MIITDDQIKELKVLWPGVQRYVEVGVDYLFIPQLSLPAGCQPAVVDALLCPTPRDGYPSRLFYSQQIQSAQSRNWHVQNARIIEKNWFTFSWKTGDEPRRLAQMVFAHIKGLQ